MSSRESPRPGSAAARASLGVHDRKPLPLRLTCLRRFDDRAMHGVGDLVRELDAEVFGAGGLETRLVFGFRQGACDAPDVAAAGSSLVGVRW